jgi:5-methylcytosine-specific restriction endonuclease McrBC regulatory subunit McrC
MSKQAWTCSNGSLLTNRALPNTVQQGCACVLYQTIISLLNVTVDKIFTFLNEEYVNKHFVYGFCKRHVNNAAEKHQGQLSH